LKPAVEPSYQERYLRRDEVHRVRHHEGALRQRKVVSDSYRTKEKARCASYCSDPGLLGMGQTEDSSTRISHQERIGEQIPSTYLADVAVVKRFCHVSRQLRICQ
jgi:hypothetical protein